MWSTVGVDGAMMLEEERRVTAGRRSRAAAVFIEEGNGEDCYSCRAVDDDGED